LSKTQVGRDINRPYLGSERISKSLQKPITKALIKLIQMRNNCEAFNGEFTISSQQKTLNMHWASKTATAKLMVNIAARQAVINVQNKEEKILLNLNALLIE